MSAQRGREERRNEERNGQTSKRVHTSWTMTGHIGLRRPAGVEPLLKKQFDPRMFLLYIRVALVQHPGRNKTMLVSTLTRDEMEQRRLEAARDLDSGFSQSTVARKFGVSRTTASRWNRALRAQGMPALKKRLATGRPCRLTTEQLSGVVAIYAEGAIVHGFSDNRWTTARMATVIEARFGVHYDEDHVGRMLHKLGVRKPRRRRRSAVAPDFSPAGFAAAYSPMSV
ncbi:MAG: helix-turn-helix domain-containing protein [Bryobacteraceae bacterium]